jgi:hypothetical protein
MDDLRERIAWIWAAYYDSNEFIPSDGGAENMRNLGDEFRALADAVLAEIGETHYVVEREAAKRIALAAGASECFEDNGAPCIRSEDWKTIDALAKG